MAVKEVRDAVDIPENFERLQEVIDEYKGKSGSLIPVLQKAQEIFGYLPLEVQKKIAEGLKVPMSRVYGVSTFMHSYVGAEGQSIR